jgi:phage replication-related protein YjqB (UPF0714/DUF867 family)
LKTPLVFPLLDAIDEEEYKTGLAAQLSRKEKELKGEDKNQIVNRYSILQSVEDLRKN